MNKRHVSRALTEVWAWKEACYRDVAHLSTRNAIKKRLADCDRTARHLGLSPPEAAVPSHRAARVAERQAPFETRKTRKS